MFNNSHLDRVRQMFADQFEPDGADFLYRKNMKGAPIKVSASERDSFVSSFNRRLRYVMWGAVPATLVLIGLLVAFAPDSNPDNPTSQALMYAGVGSIIAAYTWAYYWAWNSPARDLERRPTLGEARSKAEVRRIMFSRMTYGQLGIGALAVAAMLLKSRRDA